MQDFFLFHNRRDCGTICFKNIGKGKWLVDTQINNVIMEI